MPNCQNKCQKDSGPVIIQPLPASAQQYSATPPTGGLNLPQTTLHPGCRIG